LARQVALTTGECGSIRIGRHPHQRQVADATFDSLWEFATTIRRACAENASNPTRP
jgi:hypothetical protein